MIAHLRELSIARGWTGDGFTSKEPYIPTCVLKSPPRPLALAALQARCTVYPLALRRLSDYILNQRLSVGPSFGAGAKEGLWSAPKPSETLTL